MPHAPYALNPDGLPVPVLVGLNGAEMAARLQAGHPMVPPVSVLTLIDTGSNITCLPLGILQQLGLTAFQQHYTQTVGGSVAVNLYEASLSIPRPGGGFLLVLDQLVVMELPPGVPSPEALLGRDVLRQLLLICDGPADLFTLAD
jgi:hypothetical protein